LGKISPFAPKHPPHLPAIDGVRLAATAAGIRYPGRTDLLLALFDPGTTVAGVLTRSKTASAPVDWCRARLPTAWPARSWSIPATPMPSPADAGRRP
jgi:glutamate N-acetyltransferase/amino-acid N-acetyltransferase